MSANGQLLAVDNSPTTNAASLRNGEVLVRVEGVSKKFCRSLKKSLWYGVKDIARELNPFSRTSKIGFQRTSDESNAYLREDEFWAVNNVSFELRRGECLGLIGHNGAGKTTLLKMLNGLIKPDNGRIEMRGRVAALIALGAGFNPILSGRENIYVNASVLGLAKHEIDKKVDEIIEFAEIEDSIDAPVQSYSSGMQVRLGFAIATALKPDVLILDEVLAVGDARFRFKSGNRLKSMMRDTAVVLVSHNMASISALSNCGLVLNHGNLAYNGCINKAIETYNALSRSHLNTWRGNIEISLHESIKSARIEPPTMIDSDCSSRIQLSVESKLQLLGCIVRLVFCTAGETPVAEYNSSHSGTTYCVETGLNELHVIIPPTRLTAGTYLIDVIVQHPASGATLLRSFCNQSIEVNALKFVHAPVAIY